MALTIVATADNHVNSTRAGSRDPKTNFHSTWLEANRQLENVVKLANEREADMLVIIGDLFDNGSPSAESVAMTVDTLGKLNPFTKVVTLNGNHDDTHVPAHHRNPIDAFISTQPWCYHAAEEPEVIDFDGAKIGLVPWYRVQGKAHVDVMNDDFRGRIQDLAPQLDTKMSMLFGHLTVDECTLDNNLRGSEMMMTTDPWEATVPQKLLDDLPVSFWRLGHIHKRQALGERGGYVGSTYKVTFGEAKDQKGAEVITLEDDGSHSYEFVPFKVRELLRITLTDHEDLDPHLPDLLSKGDLAQIWLPHGEEFTTSQHKVIQALQKKDVDVEPRWLPRVREQSSRNLGSDVKIDTPPLETYESYVQEQNLDSKFRTKVVHNFKELQKEAMNQ